jgi:hypothetical protein
VVNKKLKGMEKQRGQALILVLIALVLGSLLITPTLRYVGTGLTESHISEELLLKQYAADAAVEYSLWQLKYNVDGLIDGLDEDNPSSNTTIIVNGMEVPVITEISQSPYSDNGTFPTLPSESGIHLAIALQIFPPSWSESGETGYFTHLVYIYNYGTSAAHLKDLFQQLDPALSYVAGSYEGPEADLTTTYVDDQWEMYLEFREPRPTLDSQEDMVISFVAAGIADMGELSYFGNGWVSYAGFEEDMVEYSGESGPAAFGLYDITITLGQYTILVNVGITEDGEIVLRSYQFQ